MSDRLNRRRLIATTETERYFNAAMLAERPDFFEPGLPGRIRNAALSRMIGTPPAVGGTPQERLLYTVPYVNGNTARAYSPDIPRSLYPYWTFRLGGTCSKTEGCAGSLVSEGPLPLINNIRVKADGEIVKEIDPMHLRVLSHHIMRGVDTSMTNISLGTDVAEAFAARLMLDFRTMRSANPEKTFFPADRYGQLELEVDWAATSATSLAPLISGGAYTGVSFPTPPTLQVIGREILDAGSRIAPYWLQKYTQKVFGVNAAAQVGASFQLPVGEVIRGILVSQYTNSPRVPLSTLVTATANIKIRANGSFYKYETTWGELQQKNLADYGLAMPTGYAFIDFLDPDSGGLFDTAFRADAGINTLEALVDVASVANAFLQFTLVTFKPARNFK